MRDMLKITQHQTKCNVDVAVPPQNQPKGALVACGGSHGQNVINHEGMHARCERKGTQNTATHAAKVRGGRSNVMRKTYAKQTRMLRQQARAPCKMHTASPQQGNGRQ